MSKKKVEAITPAEAEAGELDEPLTPTETFSMIIGLIDELDESARGRVARAIAAWYDE